MRRTKDVSVVLGTFNGSMHIEEQLRSIIDQTVPPVEIIVSDDGSTDDTVAVVESIAATTPIPVHILRNEVRLGFADNFLRAAAASTAALIAFSDQDDRWSPTKLERSAVALAQYDAVYCSHAVELMDEFGTDLGRRAQNLETDVVVEPRTADPWAAKYGFTVMIDRRLLEAVPTTDRGPDTYGERPVLSHDRWAYALAWSLGRAVLLAEPLARYRQHSGQLYGGPEHRSIGGRISQKAAEGPRRLRFLAEVATGRARSFGAAKWSGDRDRDEAAKAWARLGALYNARADLYDEPARLARGRRLDGLIRSGAYRSIANGGVGGKRLLEDLGFGLPGPAVRQRLLLAQKNRV